jgi:glutaredoxin
LSATPKYGFSTMDTMDRLSELIAKTEKLLDQLKSTFEIYEGFQYQRDDRNLEWQNFREKISQDQIEILTAIATQENLQDTIKKIAERNITMPSLLIDDINKIAYDTLGEIIIETNNEIPKIANDYLLMVETMI